MLYQKDSCPPHDLWCSWDGSVRLATISGNVDNLSTFTVEIYISSGQRSRNEFCLPSEGREAIYIYCNDQRRAVDLTDLCVSVLSLPLTGSVFSKLEFSDLDDEGHSSHCPIAY